jgi:acetylornithine deacetylase/succinyl-diaminopimelate desuccinylase-like protein
MAVRDAMAAAESDFLAELGSWLRIPSVSARPEHGVDVRRSAEWLCEALWRAGFPVAELWETGGHPSVYAEWPANDPGAPVILVYGHHDVQPVEEDEWDTPPFDPVRGGDELFGRGAADDKGQVVAHLFAARLAVAAGGGQTPPVTLKVLVEGEEESGSRHLPDLLRANCDRLTCDAVIVSDTPMLGPETPSICIGMRGLADCEIDVFGPDGDIHSGSFGGGVPNPAHALAGLIAQMHDDRGRVMLPGFYDRVRMLSDDERAALRRLPFDEMRWLRESARSRAAVGEAEFSTLERIWVRPTAEVNGMWSGYTGPGNKTIIPRSAHAKISFRLVSDQRPDEVIASFRQFVADHLPSGIQAEIRGGGPGVRPCVTPPDSPVLQAAIRAVGGVFGSEVVLTREGGSGPESDLADILGVPVVFVGFGLPDDRIHAANERVLISRLLKGAEAIAELWLALGGRTVG